ncbi:MAG: hypothetical protein P8175_17955 [Deltaproteobacteria bacterium]
MEKSQLRWQPILILLVLAMIWGGNMASIKIAARELPPLFMAGFRSVIASRRETVSIAGKQPALFWLLPAWCRSSSKRWGPFRSARCRET